MIETLEALLRSMLSFAPALLFAAVGATFSEKSGVVNVGVEGMMRAGALAAAMASLMVPTPLGIIVGGLAGASVALIHGWVCVYLRSNQLVSGIALNLVMLALASFILEAIFNSPSSSPPITPLVPLSLGFVAQIPILRIFSGHTAMTWWALALMGFAPFLMCRTRFGLRLRAAGETPLALISVGVDVRRLRLYCVIISGFLAGLGGATLSVATLDRFEHHMPSGLGFMAVAAMVCGRWNVLSAAWIALLFSLANAIRIGLPSSWPQLTEHIPSGLLMAFPYLLTLCVLIAQKPSAQPAPAALGQAFHPELR